MKKFTEYNTVLDSIPEEGPLNGIRSDLNEIESDPPISVDSNSWGSYIKKYGWVSSKVFTGKAIREWILSKFKTKLEVSSISVSEGSLQPPADKRFITLNKAITISDSSGNSFNINLPVLVEAEAIVYPKVYFKNTSEPVGISEITSKLDSHNTANSYSNNSTSERYFYIALPTNKSFTMVTSNGEALLGYFQKINEDSINIDGLNYNLYCFDLGQYTLDDVTSTITIK